MTATPSNPAGSRLAQAGPLAQLLVATLAYAAGLVLVAFCVVPTILTPVPVAALLPEAPPVVARTPAPEITP